MEEGLKKVLGKKVELLKRGSVFSAEYCEGSTGDQIIRVRNKEDICGVIRILRDHTGFEFKVLVDITAVDFPSREKRFELVYQLLSIRNSMRLIVKVELEENEEVESVVRLYRGGDWFEREVYDMFGIYFRGHKDMRRLLTDYGFEGHPLRKDFPLSGYIEVRYDENKKSCAFSGVDIQC